MPRRPAQLALLALLGALAGCSAPLDMEGCPSIGPQTCTQRITQGEAERIARAEGLGDGIKPWKTEFLWSAGASGTDADGYYVWTVANTTFESGVGTRRGYQAGGFLVKISAADGKPEPMQGWSAIA